MLNLEKECVSCNGTGYEWGKPYTDENKCPFCIDGTNPSKPGQILLAFIQKYSIIKLNEVGEYYALLGKDK